MWYKYEANDMDLSPQINKKNNGLKKKGGNSIQKGKILILKWA